MLIIFFIDKEFRRAPAYIIMTHIGVADALQLLIHIYSGVLVIVNADMSAISNKVIGAILTGLWFTMLAFTLFLTFNRLTTVLLHKWFPVLLSPTITYMLFFLSYLGFIVPLALKLTPHCNYVFDPDTFSWSYLPTDRPLSIVMSEMGRYLVLAIVVLSVMTYISIFVYIGLFSAARLSKRELRITIQASATKKPVTMGFEEFEHVSRRKVYLTILLNSLKKSAAFVYTQHAKIHRKSAMGGTRLV